MKNKLPIIKKRPSTVCCPSCQSSNVCYYPDATRSSWVGGREVTETGLVTCLDCNHSWHQEKPVEPAPKPVEIYPAGPEE